MSNLIVNANAPIVDVHLKIDFRYSPEQVQMTTNPPAPGIVIAKTMLAAAGRLLDMLIEAEAQAQAARRNDGMQPPDLPPAPAPTVKPD